MLLGRPRGIMWEKLTCGDVPFRKAYLGSIVVGGEGDDKRLGLYWQIIGRFALLVGKTCSSRRSSRTVAQRLGFAVLFADGAPGRIRTHDPQIRSLVLYPAELPVRSLDLIDPASVHCRLVCQLCPTSSGRQRQRGNPSPATGLHLPPCAAPYSAFLTFGTSKYTRASILGAGTLGVGELGAGILGEGRSEGICQ
jgi:hypothetical protein